MGVSISLGDLSLQVGWALSFLGASLLGFSLFGVSLIGGLSLSSENLAWASTISSSPGGLFFLEVSLSWGSLSLGDFSLSWGFSDRLSLYLASLSLLGVSLSLGGLSFS